MFGFSSTFSFPTVILPAYSAASASTVGERRLQGPHHSAQKSTSTGAPAFSTLSSKFPSVNVCTCSVAMSLSPCHLADRGSPAAVQPGSPIIYFDVLCRRTIPGMVFGHAVQLQRAPAAPVGKSAQGAVDCLEQRLGPVVAKHEPVRRPG